jgi:hypothetical protein
MGIEVSGHVQSEISTCLRLIVMAFTQESLNYGPLVSIDTLPRESYKTDDLKPNQEETQEVPIQLSSPGHNVRKERENSKDPESEGKPQVQRSGKPQGRARESHKDSGREGIFSGGESYSSSEDDSSGEDDLNQSAHRHNYSKRVDVRRAGGARPGAQLMLFDSNLVLTSPRHRLGLPLPPPPPPTRALASRSHRSSDGVRPIPVPTILQDADASGTGAVNAGEGTLIPSGREDSTAPSKEEGEAAAAAGAASEVAEGTRPTGEGAQRTRAPLAGPTPPRTPRTAFSSLADPRRPARTHARAAGSSPGSTPRQAPLDAAEVPQQALSETPAHPLPAAESAWVRYRYGSRTRAVLFDLEARLFESKFVLVRCAHEGRGSARAFQCV